MAYRIEQEGYECNGVKLGQKCIAYEEDAIIIGFDEDDDTCDNFIAVKTEGRYGDFKAKESGCITILLDGYEDSYYDWVCLNEITLINSQDEENPPKSISPIHVADILEDIIKMDITDPDEAYDVRCILNECIKSLRV